MAVNVTEADVAPAVVDDASPSLRPRDVRVLRSLPESGRVFVRSFDYDSACHLLDLGLVELKGGLPGWSAYASRTERGTRVVAKLAPPLRPRTGEETER